MSTSADARQPIIGFIAGHLPTYCAAEYDVVAQAIADLQTAADAHGISLVVHDEPVIDAFGAHDAAAGLGAAGADLIVLLHATFTMGDVTSTVADVGVPVVIWTIDEPTLDGPILLNSFVSGLMGSSILRASATQDHTDWLHGRHDDPAFAVPFAALAGALRARVTLRETTIGFLGGIAPTFDNFDFDRRAVTTRLGIALHEAPLDGLFSLVASADPADVASELAAIDAFVDRSAVSERVDEQRTAAIALALRRYAVDHACTALAVSDWSEFQDALDIHPGMAFSWVDHTDEMSVSCEGDVLGAASMVALRAVAGSGACLLDVVGPSPDRDCLQLWHCGGSPFDLADSHGVGMVDHSTLGRKVQGSRMTGAVADMVFRPGPVTMLRIGNDLERAFVAEATVVPGPSRGFDGTRGWVADWMVDGTAMVPMAVANLLVTNGVEHHVALVGGHHAAALGTLARWLGLDIIG